MKQLMYAVYTTKKSIMPRTIYSRWREARDSIQVWRGSEIMGNYGFIKRVILEVNEKIGAYNLYHHEYRKI